MLNYFNKYYKCSEVVRVEKAKYACKYAQKKLQNMHEKIRKLRNMHFFLSKVDKYVTNAFFIFVY